MVDVSWLLRNFQGQIFWLLNYQIEFTFAPAYKKQTMSEFRKEKDTMGIVNVPATVTVQPVEIKQKPQQPSKPEFYNGDQEMVEIFVYSPLALPTNLPTCTSMLKY